MLFRSLVLVLCLACCISCTGAGNVGVNYGTMANDLPPPSQVAQLLLSTSLRNVKLYNADQATLQAFANTGIKVVIGVGNDVIPVLATSVTEAQAWVQSNVAAYMPATSVSNIAVGNEVLVVAPELEGQLVSAILNIHTALVNLKLDAEVKVSSPQSLTILSTSYPPSAGAFNSSFQQTFQQLLDFHAKTASPLMVNAYPYFAYRDDPQNVSLNYVLFETNAGITDSNTGLHYTNMLDAQLDAVSSAMARLGHHNDIAIVVSETGWPSNGDVTELAVGISNAQTYNANLIKHIASNVGTPLSPNASFDAYIFSLFNEDLKPGPASERNYGLFNPNEIAVYNVGLVQTNLVPTPPGENPPPAALSPPATTPSPLSPPSSLPPPETPTTPTTAGPSTSPTSSGSPAGKTWCVAKAGATTEDLMHALDYACGAGAANCQPIQDGQACFAPNTLLSHATWAFNEYYHQNGRNYWDCFFGNTAVVSITDPSYAGCPYS